MIEKSHPVETLADYNKYIVFEQVAAKAKTSVWQVVNRKSRFGLGLIEWYPQWRQYTFSPVEGGTFNDECMVDIANFMTNLRHWEREHGEAYHED